MTKRKKELVTGGDPELKFPLPSQDDWAGADYLLAKPVGDIGEALIASRNELKHLEDAKIAYIFKLKGPKRGGKAVLGTCQRVSGLLGFFSGVDFVITLMANHLFGATRWMVEAIVYHELLHAGTNENGEWTTIPHDCECFGREIERYGLWKSDLARIGKSTEYAMSLPFDTPIEAAIDAAEAAAADGHARVEKIFESPAFDKAIKEQFGDAATVTRENGVPTVHIETGKRAREARPS